MRLGTLYEAGPPVRCARSFCDGQLGCPKEGCTVDDEMEPMTFRFGSETGPGLLTILRLGIEARKAQYEISQLVDSPEAADRVRQEIQTACDVYKVIRSALERGVRPPGSGDPQNP